jgi:ADP-heptose:LPS heptosyltransferase
MVNVHKKNIVLYRTKGIGDVILSFEGLHLLQQQEANIFYIGYGSSLDLIRHFFPTITIIDIGKHGFYKTYLIAKSRLSIIDGFIDLQMNSRSVALVFMLWLKFHMQVFRWNKRSIARRIIVLANKLTGRWCQFPFVRNYKQSPVEERMIRCIVRCINYFYGIQQLEIAEKPFPMNGRETNKLKKRLVIAPGGSHQSKQAPSDLVVSIVQHLNLMKGSGLEICLVGDENDSELCRDIEISLNGKIDIHNVSGKINLIELTGILEEAYVLLATDSAIAHLGNYLKIPKAILLGPTLEGFGYAVKGQKTKVFSSQINCRPCSRNGDMVCFYQDKFCFRNINPNEVAEYLSLFLP